MAFLMAFIILIKSSDALHWAYFPNKCFLSNAGQLALMFYVTRNILIGYFDSSESTDKTVKGRDQTKEQIIAYNWTIYSSPTQ